MDVKRRRRRRLAFDLAFLCLDSRVQNRSKIIKKKGGKYTPSLNPKHLPRNHKKKERKKKEIGLETSQEEEEEEEEEGLKTTFDEGEREREREREKRTPNNASSTQTTTTTTLEEDPEDLHHHRSTKSSGMEESDVHAEVISAAELNELVSRMNGNGSSAAGENNAQSVLAAMERLLRGNGERQEREPAKKEHKFWSTQPVPQFEIKEDTREDGEDVDGPIDPSKTVADVRKEGYDLPPGYEWDEVDVETQEGRDEVFNLLASNYVEDDDEMFRFAYAPEFVSWALQPPGYEKSWHVGIRISCTKTLVALITGIPAEVSANEKRLKVAEINFLCVHKKLRRKNFAPVLIREVTRRINLKDVWQAAYTAGVVLPKPCAKARYWHRSINVKKLVDIRFTQLGRGMSMAETIEHYAMPKKIRVQGLRKMEEKDVPTVTRLLNSYFSKFKLAPVKNEEDVRHWLVPRDEVVYSYVKIDECTGEATDFCSFYNLSSTVIQASSSNGRNAKKNVLLKAAYCYYNVATSENIEDLIQDALILARDNGFDVFNALNVSENDQFLETLKFGIGDGDLHYYLYNWKLRETLAPKDVALVLL